MMQLKIYFILFAILFFISNVTAIPFIVGFVNNAADGTSPNGRTVQLWNPAVGESDNVTDIIGTTGNSGTSNIYMIDCALLSGNCSVGMNIRVKLLNESSSYLVRGYVNTTINGAGFQQMNNMTLNSPPVINSTIVDDSFSSPVREIDLSTSSSTLVTCQGVITDADGDTDTFLASSILFDSNLSSLLAVDDNNDHYTNNSCGINTSYGGGNESFYNCSFFLPYYANSDTWNCTVNLSNNLSFNRYSSNISFVNPLLALELPASADFGGLDSSPVVSGEIAINVSNFGNVMINLSLEGYAMARGDNNSMNCTSSNNISVYFTKYNLTASNPGTLSLSQFEASYSNLTSSSVTRKFNLAYRHADSAPYLDNRNSTYWRVYVPSGIDGGCTGNIIFSANRAVGI